MNDTGPRLRFRWIFPYLAAILANFAVTLPLFWMRDKLNISTVALIYLLPVLMITLKWGLSSGLFTGFTAFFIFNYFFIAPYYTLRVHKAEDITVLIIFLLVAVLIGQLVGRVQENLAAATTRERQARRLYELSLALSRSSHPSEIASVIASQTQEAFLADFVEVSGSFPGDESCNASAPEGGELPVGKPVLIIPLQTPRRFLGEIHIWRSGGQLDASEERMLRTFASQGALALERAELAQNETRTRVLEESDRMKSALLSSVSHELRTPLSTIKAAVTSILGGEVDWGSEAAQDLLAAVDEETDQLNRLVGNLLDMSRIEAGALNPDLQWNELPEIVESALHRMRHILQDFHVSVNMPEELPLVPVDFMQIERVFTNLLSNSAKYAPPGSQIEINVATRPAQELWVQITNQGPAIPEEHLERIFDKFYRLTSAARITGTGLGLSICKGIIEAHDGRIWAENLPDRFAFNFTLPLTWKGKSPVAVESES